MADLEKCVKLNEQYDMLKLVTQLNHIHLFS